jgi:alkylation response protein AidB-like acyl-CoA dehydrogenase
MHIRAHGVSAAHKAPLPVLCSPSCAAKCAAIPVRTESPHARGAVAGHAQKCKLVSPVERVGRIAEVIAKSGAANEALGRLTPEVVDKLNEQRMFRMLLPRVYGGDEVDLVTWFRAMETLGKLDGSTAWCVGQINGCSATASALAPEVARKIWGERRSARAPTKSRAATASTASGCSRAAAGTPPGSA